MALILQRKDQRAGGTGRRRPRKISLLEQFRRAVVEHLRQQRSAVLGWIKDETQRLGDDLPGVFPMWDQFKLGARALATQMTPVISLMWDQAGTQFASRIGLDPDEWSVTNPHTAAKIQGAALAFAQSTNESTSLDLHDALDQLRDELAKGIVDRGDTLPQLTKRVQQVFDGAETWKARQIAKTESVRARHAAQVEMGKQSGVVVGWKWVASSDACPQICLVIVRDNPVTPIDKPFAVHGKNPTYNQIYHPPAHPNCECSLEPIFADDPEAKLLPHAHTLIQPEPLTDEQADETLGKLSDEEQEILRESEAWGAAPYETRYPGAYRPPKLPTKPTIPQHVLSFDQALARAVPTTRYMPHEEQTAKIAELVDKYAMPGPTIAAHNMAQPEAFQTITVQGLPWHFSGEPEKASAVVTSIWNSLFLTAKGPLPQRLLDATRAVYFTGQSDKNRPNAAATGGNGEIVVYGGEPITPRILAHETAHNLAKQIYGSTNPGGDFSRVITHTHEKPVSEYGKTTPAEDFATAVEMWYMDREKLAKQFPERFRVINRLMTDPHYEG
jgi:hypothetical protein